MVWEADAAADLAAGLRDWADSGLASLLGGLMSWRGRDREEVATVARRLRDTRPGGWNGGGALGELLGVRTGAMTASSDKKGHRADWGVGGGDMGGGGGGVGEMEMRWPPQPPPLPPHTSSDRTLEGATDHPHEDAADGYSADAD